MDYVSVLASAVALLSLRVPYKLEINLRQLRQSPYILGCESWGAPRFSLRLFFCATPAPQMLAMTTLTSNKTFSPDSDQYTIKQLPRQACPA
jgi:hypothetical protein